VEKSKDLSKNAWKQAQKRRRAASKAYYDLAKRGEKLASSVRRSVYTRRAMDQAKATRSQLKATVTGMRKTARATGQATKAAAKKVG